MPALALRAVAHESATSLPRLGQCLGLCPLTHTVTHSLGKFGQSPNQGACAASHIADDRLPITSGDGPCSPLTVQGVVDDRKTSFASGVALLGGVGLPAWSGLRPASGSRGHGSTSVSTRSCRSAESSSAPCSALRERALCWCTRPGCHHRTSLPSSLTHAQPTAPSLSQLHQTRSFASKAAAKGKTGTAAAAGKAGAGSKGAGDAAGEGAAARRQRVGVETWAQAPQLLTDVDRYLSQRRSKMWKQYQAVLEQQQREADSLAGPSKGDGAKEVVLPPVLPAGGCVLVPVGELQG